MLNLNRSPEIVDPIEIIDTMIELRIQRELLQAQIDALQSAFFAACLLLNQDKITRTRAIISRRLSAAQWTYAAEITEQEAFLKQLRKQFQQDHEPTGGREITWMVRLLLGQSSAGL